MNKEQFETAVSFHFSVFTYATKIIDLMPIDINTVNKDSLSFYISKTFSNYTFNPQQSTINSLTNTSSFEIISNLELRGLLQNWDEMVKDYGEEEMTSRTYSFDFYFPYLREHISFRNVSAGENIFFNPEIDLGFLNELTFENIIAFRIELIKDIINPVGDDELENVREAIDRIIELTGEV